MRRTVDAALPADSVLGVARSLGGRRWRLRDADPRAARAIAQRHDLSDILARVLAAREVPVEAVESFLNPTLRALLPDPSLLTDMDAAVARALGAIRAGEGIAVFADYDVDGACSAALLARFLRAIGQAVTLYVPDRLSEGYGPNAAALMRLKQAGARLVITVDCGTTAHDALAAAQEAGLDVIVLDHHVAEPRLPAAAAVVNPNRFGEESGLGNLAAVGVTFLFCVALNRALRAEHCYGEGHAEPDLRVWLDLVALGTVCDVVPLTGVNRALVGQGLKVMARRGNAGLAALADIARLDARPDVYHAGFLLGPRVNAGGRVGEAGLGARLLATEDAAEAAALAARLDGWNRERQAIEAAVLEDALATAEAEVEAEADGLPLVLVAGEGWHPGVIGIVAGRLRERFHRPALVVALDGGIGRGSGRSVPGVALGPAVVAAHQAGLLLGGGGHAMAAGFTVAAEKLVAFRDFLIEHVGARPGAAPPVPDLALDGVLHPGGADAALVESLEAVGPFGAGNPRPRFAFPAVAVDYAEPVGGGHVRCRVGAPGPGPRLKAIAFRAGDTGLGRALLARDGTPLHLAGQLRIDRWKGRSEVQLTIEDAAPVAP